MSGYDLEELQSLHRDLIALSESRLLNVERLCVQLEARVDEFRHLLEKAPRNEKSRQILAAGNADSNLLTLEIEADS
jgi:nuclear pore complex protein Nup205